MKIITASSGKKTLKISRSEWEAIGKKAGWEASPDMDALDFGPSVPTWHRESYEVFKSLPAYKPIMDAGVVDFVNEMVPEADFKVGNEKLPRICKEMYQAMKNLSEDILESEPMDPGESDLTLHQMIEQGHLTNDEAADLLGKERGGGGRGAHLNRIRDKAPV